MSYNGSPEDPVSVAFGQTWGLDEYRLLNKHIGGIPIPHLADRAVGIAIKRVKPEVTIDARTAAASLMIELSAEITESGARNE